MTLEDIMNRIMQLESKLREHEIAWSPTARIWVTRVCRDARVPEELVMRICWLRSELEREYVTATGNDQGLEDFASDLRMIAGIFRREGREDEEQEALHLAKRALSERRVFMEAFVRLHGAAERHPPCGRIEFLDAAVLPPEPIDSVSRRSQPRMHATRILSPYLEGSPSKARTTKEDAQASRQGAKWGLVGLIRLVVALETGALDRESA